MKRDKISVVGFMGSGKTTIGLLLANFLNYFFYDLDGYIEKKEGKSIKNIFADYGEEYFRNLESFYLEELIEKHNKIVISTGGGIIKREINRKLLKEKTFVVFLDGSFEVFMNRLEGTEEKDKRPLMSLGKDELYNLWISRKPLYEEVATLKINVDSKTPYQIVREILDFYGKM